MILLESECEPVSLSFAALSDRGCQGRSEGWMVVWVAPVFTSGQLGGVPRIKGFTGVALELHFENEMCQSLCTPMMLCGNFVPDWVPTTTLPRLSACCPACRFRTCHLPELHEPVLTIKLSCSLCLCHHTRTTHTETICWLSHGES